MEAPIKKSAEELARDEALRKYREGDVTIVNADELAKFETKYAADEAMNRKKGEDIGWFKRVWKYKLFEPYYRQKEINEARKRIEEEGDIYANQEQVPLQGHEATMGALVDRFSSEFDEMIETQRGETRQVLDDNSYDVNIVKKQILDLVKKYAAGKISDAGFQEAKHRIFDSLHEGQVADAQFHADNIFEMAKNAKIAVEHGVKIDELDRDFKIIIGKAKAGVKTEAQYTWYEKVEDKIAHSKIGRFVNPATMATAVGIAGTVVGVSKLAGRMGISAAATFVGSAAASGLLNAFDEGYKLKTERAQDAIERARGKQFQEGLERRDEMEDYTYQTEEASALLKKLETHLTLGSAEELHQMLITMAEVDAYQKISNERKIDLITYSRLDQVEQEKTALLIRLAKMKVAMRNTPGMTEFLGGKTFDEYMKSLVAVKQREILGGEKGIAAQDEKFESYQHRQMWKVFKKTMVRGVLFGALFQEGIAAVSDHTHGLVDTLRGNEGEHTAMKTPLESLRGWIFGHESMVPMGVPHQEIIDGANMQLPEGVSMIHGADGYTFMQGDRIIAEHLQLHGDPTTGGLDQSSIAELARHGIQATPESALVAGAGHTSVSAEEYLKNHPGTEHIARDGWYDNNTHAFDKNELKLWWGGENGTGIDTHGNYVFNVSHMTQGGSFHDSLSVDALEKIKSGGLKIALSVSEGTQHHVFMYNVDEFGNIHVPPTDEAGKILFSNVGGHAVFHGRFAEVVETFGKDATGAEHVHMLATYEGKGLDTIDVPGPAPVSFDQLHFPLGTEMPYFIPLVGRKPLEEGENPEVKKSSIDDAPITKKTIDTEPADTIHKVTDATEAVDSAAVIRKVADTAPADAVMGVAAGAAEKVTVKGSVDSDRDVYAMNDALTETREKFNPTPSTGELRSRITILSMKPESQRTDADKAELAAAERRLAEIRAEAAVAERNKAFFAGTATPETSADDEDESDNGADYYRNRVMEGTSSGTLGTVGFSPEVSEYFTDQDRDRAMKEYALKSINEKISRGEGTDLDLDMGIRLERELYGNPDVQFLRTPEITSQQFESVLKNITTIGGLYMNLQRFEKIGTYEVSSLVKDIKRYLDNKAPIDSIPVLSGLRDVVQKLKKEMDEKKTSSTDFEPARAA